MRRFRPRLAARLACALTAVGVLAATAYGGQTAEAAPPAFDELRVAGFDAVYELDYPAARVAFDRMIHLDRNDPAGFFYLATYYWLTALDSLRRLQIAVYSEEAFYDSAEDAVDHELDLKFHGAIRRTLAVADKRLETNPNDVEALYYRGAALGLRASYDATVARRFLPAFGDAAAGVKCHQDVLVLDPNFADAKLSIGIYEYVIGTLPWPVKLGLKLIGVGGNRVSGMKKIEDVVESGRYARDDARTVLIALYEREEQWAKALALVDDLVVRYPTNYLFQLERATLYSRLGRSGESRAAFQHVLEDTRASRVADLVHLRFGEALLRDDAFKDAADQFAAVPTSPSANAALVSLSYVRRGQSLDAAGDRSGAVAMYKLALQRDDALSTHKQAHRYLKRRYMPDDAK